MAILGWVVVGLVAGLMTTVIFRHHRTGGVAGALGVGVAGALAAGGTLAVAGVAEPGVFFDFAAWLLAFGLALLLLAVYHSLTHDESCASCSVEPAASRRIRQRGEPPQPWRGRRNPSPCQGRSHLPSAVGARISDRRACRRSLSR